MFIVSTITPMTLGHNIRTTDEKSIVEDYTFDSYHVSEISNYKQDIYREPHTYDNMGVEKVINSVGGTQPLDGPLDSPWPMYCHDVRHTGQSPYNTAENKGDEKWWFKDETYYMLASPVIDKDGIIYCGSLDFYAIYPNGTMKWKYDDLDFYVWSAPAIDENGVLYVGDKHGYFYAINPDGTLKWDRSFEDDILSSPAIGDDGTIYFGNEVGYPLGGYINALYPNGTVKWRFPTNHVVYSSPAIGDDGTIYCGSHDTYLYALYPNNGTLKWKYKTENWIRTSPCIADDGTIYVVSLDSHLHAVNPDGTKKWSTDVGAGTSPTLGQDGTIYAGYQTLHAVNPSDGSVKWTYPVNGKIRGGTPCNSIDGTIYFGTENGWFYAINSDGTLKFEKKISNKYIESAPAIGEDGTVYVCSGDQETHGSSIYDKGYLHAFGELDHNAPSEPQINGQISGKPETEYDYTFKSTSPLGNDVYYWIEWGDGTVEGWIGPYSSGEVVIRSHSWSYQRAYTIRAIAKDIDNLWGPWGELDVTMPRNKATTYSLLLRFLEHFPLLERFLSILLI